MCLFPRVIQVKSRKAGLNVQEGSVFVPYHVHGDFFVLRPRLSLLYGMSSMKNIVPCGKCTECLRKRQNDIAVRAMREASKRGSMVFCTLTYDNEYLPLSIRLVRVDKNTGEEFPGLQNPLVRYEGEENDFEHLAFIQQAREGIERIGLSSVARVLSVPIYETETDCVYYEITPSLNRRDLRLWIKSCRVQYKRDKGVELPDFSYIACGEYGPKTCRPHYHVCFFGLNREQVSYFVSRWKYGFTNTKVVNAINEDGSNGYELASKYVGKYLSKGKFECDSVKCGQSEKPRLMLSIGLGNDIDEQMMFYYRCYDLFGKYDINRFPKQFSAEQLKILFSEIRKRSFIQFGKTKYCLPKSLIIKLWYIYNSNYKVYESSFVRRMYSASLQSDLLSDFISKQQKASPGISSGDLVNACSEFIMDSENAAILQESFNEGAFRSFYGKSIF